MKSAVAIKRFMESEPNGSKVAASELAEFKKSMPEAEYHQLGRDACESLGQTWEPSDA